MSILIRFKIDSLKTLLPRSGCTAVSIVEIMQSQILIVIIIGIGEVNGNN